MTSLNQIFLAIPLWAVFVGTLVLVLACAEGGYRLARQRQQRDREREKEAPVGAMVGAAMGLLSLLLAFAFGIATDAFTARKAALVNEANSIRMTYLLCDAIPELHRSAIRTVLREYVDERLQWADGKIDMPGKTATDLVGRFWKEVAAVGAENPGDVDVFLGYAARVIELQQERVMVRERSRIPAPVWLVLYLLAILGMTGVGYHDGVARGGRSPVMFAVTIAFSAVIIVIVDLNRPGEGLINVSQQPMIELREMMANSAQ